MRNFSSYNRSAVRYALDSAAALLLLLHVPSKRRGGRLGIRRAAIVDHAITVPPISNYRWRSSNSSSSIWMARVLGNWNWRWLWLQLRLRLRLRCWPWLIATNPDFGCCHLSVALANFRRCPGRPIHYWHWLRALPLYLSLSFCFSLFVQFCLALCSI